MKDKCFLDTNILIYSCDEADLNKKSLCIKFLERICETEIPVISTQSLGEFFNIAVKKLNFSKQDAVFEVQKLVKAFPVYEIRTKNVLHAMEISRSTQFSYWDSLILSMAIDTGCSVLYSEDLNNGQEIEGVKIVNPFSRISL